MALVLKDRVLETCTSPGTGTITLLGAVTGYQAFSTVGNGNTCYYAIADQNGANWECGIGTYSSGTLARTTVLSSSNAGSLTNFSTGSQNVFLTYPSERSVNLSSAALTSGRVAYATTDGLLTDSANLLYSGTDLTVYGLTVGRGAGAVASNTVVGFSAGAADTTGSDNTYIGAQAGLVSTGSTNTAVGSATLGRNAVSTSGANNTALGGYSLTYLTTGANNVALGSQSLFSNTTASNNTAIGYQAGYSNTTGVSHTVFGYQAGYSNVSGNQNCFFGPFAGYATTGGLNTFVGGESGSLVTSGTKNTIIGRYNGNQGGLDIRTASNYIVLSDGDGNPRQVIDGTGNVGIGTSSQNERLRLNSSTAAQARMSISYADSTISFYGSYSGITGTGNATDTFLSSANVLAFGSGGTTERMRLDSSGNLRVGLTTAAYNTERLTVYNSGDTESASFVNTAGANNYTVVVSNRATTGDNKFMLFTTEVSDTTRGSITYNRSGGLVAYNVTSDYRAKDIIGSVTNSGEVIDSVPVYMGKMKGATQERPMFIAHETPEYAHTGEKDAKDADGNPVYQQMDASTLIPVMWAEIQFLRQRITTLENK